MAQAPYEPESGRSADFVSSIVTDPKSVPDVMRLYGYPGASSEEGHERLYLNPDLTNYVEVPASAILHRMTVPADQDPHGAVCWWVKKDAALVYKMAPAAQALAHYFAGAIQAGMAGAAAAPVAGAQPQTAFVVCATPPVTVLCPVQTPFCPPTPFCPVHTVFCPVQTPFCPQPTLACPPGSIACGSIGCVPGGQAGFARQAQETYYVTCGQNCLIPSEIPGQTCFPAGGCGQAGVAAQAAAVYTQWAWCTQQCHPGGGVPWGHAYGVVVAPEAPANGA